MTQPDLDAAIHIGAVMGDLHITPWQGIPEEPGVRVSCDGEPWRPLADGENLADDTIIQVAGSFAINIGRVHGDLGIQGLLGSLIVDEVEGDVTAHNLKS